MTDSPTSLAHYEHVSLYETSFKTRKQDVRFFCDIAEQYGGPVLEYGAGTGRVTLSLAKAGVDVTAVDLSQPMLKRLESNAARLRDKARQHITIRSGDMRRLKLKEQFPLVFATFNVVGHLATFRDMSAFLRRAKDHLAPGGRLLFDVPIPHPDEVEADPEELFKAPRFKHPDTGEWIRQTERFEYNPAKQTLLVESHLKPEGARDGVTIPLVLRQWYPKELEAILLYEGFSEVESFADYTQNPGMMATDTLIFCARV